MFIDSKYKPINKLFAKYHFMFSREVKGNIDNTFLDYKTALSKYSVKNVIYTIEVIFHNAALGTIKTVKYLS